MKKGKVIILSGPSGSGKTTFYRKILKDKKFQGRIVKSISMTTRGKRPGEKHGRDYFFISKRLFDSKRKRGHFLESMKVFSHYYGTSLKQVRDALRLGKNVLLCIDVKGARVASRKFPDAVKIFVKAPNQKALKERLKKRETEGKRDLQIRLKTAQKELKEASRYDHIIVNDDRTKAYGCLVRILKGNLSI